MTNIEVAKLLRSVAASYQVLEKPLQNTYFRVVAYNKAADSVEHLTSEIKDLWVEGKINKVPGIGSGIAQYLDELFKTGNIKHFEEVMTDLPPAMFELLTVPGIGPKRAYKLTKELGITKSHGAIEKLLHAVEKGRVQHLEGFGKQSEKEIIETIKQTKDKTTRFLLPFATTMSEDLLEYLRRASYVLRAEPLGSLRRQVSTIGDIDIAVASNHPREVIEHFLAYPKKTKNIEKGDVSAAMYLPGGIHVDLMLQPPESFGALLQHFTGSKFHNVALRTYAQKKGLSLSEYGIKKDGKVHKFSKEHDFYKFIGMEWIPPELREDQGEIQAARTRKLPNLIKLKNLKGDLHLHSNFLKETSHDTGQDSMEEMIEEAEQLGWEYIAFTEHNPKMTEKESVILQMLAKKAEHIKKLNECRSVKIFNSLEIDIKPNGELAIPQKGLEYLDFAVAAIHSSFRGTKIDQTKRVLRALKIPKVRILAHPTGRMLNSREGIDLDWEKVFQACLDFNVILEINSWPERLDLPDTLVHDAIKHGVKLCINTDSHTADQMDLIRYGVSVARRGWAEKKDIINTLEYNKIEKLLRR